MALFLVSLLVLVTFQDVAPTPPLGELVPLFDGTDLDNWQVPQGKAGHFAVADGVMRVTAKSGWLLTSSRYDDFVLTFEARGVGRDSAGGVFIRTVTGWKGAIGYEVQVANRRRPSEVLRLHRGTDVIPIFKDAPAVSLDHDKWHEYRVLCEEDTASVSRDGEELVTVRGLSLNSGPIGVHAERGTVELRNIRIQKTTDPRPALDGVNVPPRDGLSVPRPIFEAKPQYTSEAMRLGIVGEVWVECVVDANGLVERCRVARRLSTELDAQALDAAKNWRFTPGARDGVPARVLVTLGMTFDLK